MTALPDLHDESGTTLVELLVGMAMGMIVLLGLTMTIIVVLHGNARVDARVEATDNARVAVTRIMEELHSACVSPQIAPVREESTANSLVFWHAASGENTAVEPHPVKSVIAYNEAEKALWQTDYEETGGTSPNWVFATTGRSRKLLSNVAPPSGSTVFTYERYEGGTTKKVSLAGNATLGEAAISVIFVSVALTAAPKSTPVRDAGAAATVKDSATLRLTPPSFNEGASALPCQ
jgi:hypothetical protein